MRNPLVRALAGPSLGRECGEVLATGEERRMVGLDAPLEDRQGAAMEGGGGVCLAPVGEKDGEVVQRRCEVGVVASEQVLEQREPTPIEILRLVEPATPE